MNEETIWLGPAPALERCAQLGQADYPRHARAECRAYIEAIRKVCGREPEGARLVVLSQDHDAGTYYEVACQYDADNEWACAYAARVDSAAPTTWEQAGMTAPRAQERVR